MHSVRFTAARCCTPGTLGRGRPFLSRVAEEIARLDAEKAELRDQVHALPRRCSRRRRQEPPSDQAVRILAIAQQTADNYVAEAEDFSRR